MNGLRHTIMTVAVVAACLFGYGSQAHAAVYTWSRHNLTFETPDGGFVTYNSNTRFEIHWDEMVMTVQLYEKGDENSKTIDNNLKRKASGFNMYDTRIEKIKVKGFDAKCVSGTMPDGSRGLIADLISKKGNLIVEVTVNYLLGNRDAVEDMVKSFAENKTQQPNREKHKQKVQKKSDAIRQDQQKQEEQKKLQEQQQRTKKPERTFEV